MRALTNISVFLFLLIAKTGFSQPEGSYIALNGNQFLDENGEAFYPMVMNYYVNLAYPDNGTPNTSNTHVFRASHVGANGAFCCGSITDGMQNLEQDFREMVNLGYNAIRLIFKPKKQTDADTNFVEGFYLEVKGFPSGSSESYKKMNINAPYDPSSNPELKFYLDELLAIIQLADNLGLKVICPLAEDSPSTIMNSQQDDLNDYIAAVARFMYLNNVKNILAYEFIGEPANMINDNSVKKYPEITNTKSDVCRMSKRWVETVNENDPGRLTTVGSLFYGDAFAYGWDPNFLHVDFVNVHFYPVRVLDEYNQSPSQSLEYTIDRYLDFLYTYDEYLKKPYIVGETGFRSKESADDVPAIEGDHLEQQYFVQKTLPFIKEKTYAGGYAWWILHDEVWLTNSKYGLLKEENPVLSNVNTGWVPHRKPAAYDFIDFYNGNLLIDNSYSYGPTSPAYDVNDLYYNPSRAVPNNYSFLSPENGVTYFGHLEGFVEDQDGNPIAGAIVMGSNFDYKINSDAVIQSVTARTDENGYFEIYIYDRHPDNDANENYPEMDRVFHDIKIGAYGSIFQAQRGWNDVQIQNNDTYILPSFQSELYKEVANLNVPAGNSSTKEALSTLEISYSVIEGTGDFSAEKIVELLDGFDARPDSEVHIYNSLKTIDCNDIQNLEANNKKAFIGVDEKVVDKTIEVFPNPSRDVFYVKLDEKVFEEVTVDVYDINGKLILSQKGYAPEVKIDLSDNSPGAYSIMLKWAGGTHSEKLILE